MPAWMPRDLHPWCFRHEREGFVAVIRWRAWKPRSMSDLPKPASWLYTMELPYLVLTWHPDRAPLRPWRVVVDPDGVAWLSERRDLERAAVELTDLKGKGGRATRRCQPGSRRIQIAPPRGRPAGAPQARRTPASGRCGRILRILRGHLEGQDEESRPNMARREASPRWVCLALSFCQFFPLNLS